jgi:hypothetical protein
VAYIASAIILGAALLCQWLLAPAQLSATPEKPVSDEKQKGILLILNIVFLLAPWVVPQMPAVVRWFLWFGFCVLTTILIQLYRGKPKGAERRVSVQNPSFSWWPLLGNFVPFASGYVLFLSVSKIYSKKPLLAVFASLAAVALILTTLIGTKYRSSSGYLTVFLTLVGVITRGVKRWNNPLRYALDFRNWYLVLLLIWVYINWVFSGMPPRWGGGQLTSVQIFQSTPLSWSTSNPIDALLLDQSDQGYYVLLSSTGKAFFIPQSNVSSIFFGPKEDLSKKP